MRRAWCPFLVLLFVTLVFGPALMAQAPAIPKVWNGETIEADQGLVSLYAIMIDSKMSHRSGSFSFIIRGKKNKLAYNFAASTQEPKQTPNQFWKIKEDEYELIEVNFTDEKGRPRKWKGSYPKSLIVSPKSLASMGIWYMLTMKDDQIKVLLKPVHMNLPLDRWKGSVQTITDAFTGAVLSRYKPAAADKERGFRRVITSKRSIQMIYKLDLFKMNAQAPLMAKVLQANDADMRSCYTDLLEKQANAKGNLIYSFVYSGIDQGIKSLKVKSTALRDSEFQECLYFKLRGLTFPLRASLAGELSFQFNIVE